MTIKANKQPSLSLLRQAVRASLIIITFMSSVSGAFQNGDDAPEDSLGLVDWVISLYDEGRIAEAEHQALKALDGPKELTGFERYNLYRVLAFCAIANDDEAGGVRYFIATLNHNPELKPDLITWSPKVRKVFNIARSEFDKQQAEKRRMQIAVEADVCRKASIRSLYWPGGGQIKKDKTLKGAIITALFAGSLSSFIYSQSMLPTMRDDYLSATSRSRSVKLYNDYKDMQYTANITGLVTAGIYCYAFFDALWDPPQKSDKYETIENQP